MTADRPRLSARACGATAIALIAAVTLAACGGGSSGSGKTPATASAPAGASGASGTAGRSALQSCLKRHGVTLPAFAGGPFGRPGGARRFGPSGPSGAAGGQFFQRFGGSGRLGASGPSRFPGGGSKFAAAFRACAADVRGFARGFAHVGAGSAGFSASSAADRDAVRKFVACVRQHGYDLPAPNLSGNGPVFRSSQVNRSDPKFVSASRACASVLRF